MTDDEIIKALNYCCGNIKNNDEECNEDMCYQVCLPESREEGIRWCRQWLIKDTLDLINRQQAKIERLQQNIDGLNIVSKNHIKCIQFEAIKEFVERLKEGYEGIDGQYIDRVLNAEIDKLVKEMTEVSENENYSM